MWLILPSIVTLPAPFSLAGLDAFSVLPGIKLVSPVNIMLPCLRWASAIPDVESPLIVKLPCDKTAYGEPDFNVCK